MSPWTVWGIQMCKHSDARDREGCPPQELLAQTATLARFSDSSREKARKVGPRPSVGRNGMVRGLEASLLGVLASWIKHAAERFRIQPKYSRFQGPDAVLDGTASKVTTG